MKKVFFLFLLLFFALPFFVLAEQIDINSANISQLDEIVHVGPKTAQKIVDARPYSSVGDLSRIKGIGNGKYLQDIINQGWACVNCQTTATQATQTIQPAPTTSPTPSIIYPNGVIINEILPNPKGPDATDEWFELYNSNSFSVDLSGWQVTDSAGAVTTFTIPQNTSIAPAGFLVFGRPETKIILDNGGDALSLYSPQGQVMNAVSYANAPVGQSYNRIGENWEWSSSLTPGAQNSITETKASISAPQPQASPQSGNPNKNTDMQSVAALLSATALVAHKNTTQSRPITGQTDTNPWFLFYIVLSAMIIMAAVILVFTYLKRNKNGF